ncbi:MAG: hypothetical protein E7393_02895 [Ruminococcaceae bacterium]|nr:hypothetical protein [Oscillospiraceae bacterium]
MLYPKSKEKTLSEDLFKNPTSEYRGAPFWAWNCELTPEILTEQIGYLQEMGFGGFHMHSRSGMATEYLSKDFADLVRLCTKEAKKRGMLSWLYDEDRWPSGAAGGLVTKNPLYRHRFLCITQNHEEYFEYKDAISEGKTYLVACYDICLNDKKELLSYNRIEPSDTPVGTKWYVFAKVMAKGGFFNNQTYVNTLNKESMDEFIRTTYEFYKKTVGDEFDKTVPAIFTDEPQCTTCVNPLKTADGYTDAGLPWTPELPEKFYNLCGIDLLKTLPEVLWQLPDNAFSKTRYYFIRCVTDLFASSFLDNIGKWCEKNNCKLTGHVMDEACLSSYGRTFNDTMRSYKKFHLPGIDMLGKCLELNTAKQCQSAVQQFGREGMMSELYGITDWDFDFRGHKFQGDWQTALGVTVRVPHLSWVSMEGEAKRDYPASINYQSPWFKEYRYIEDHFARVNTALTRGKPICSVAVIHPVESYWLLWGPLEQTAIQRNEREKKHAQLTEWLLYNQIDFNFISESLLPDQYCPTESGLQIGKMTYDTVLVPDLLTMRSSTLQALHNFRSAGGRVIFMGNIPEHLDAVPSKDVYDFAQTCEHIPFDMASTLQALESERFIDIQTENGTRASHLLYNLRADGDCKWLFIADCYGKDGGINQSVPKTYYSKPYSTRENLTIKIKGQYTPVLYNTLNGEITDISYEIKNDMTYVSWERYSLDSLLLQLTPPTKKAVTVAKKEFNGKVLPIPDVVSITRHEPNVLLLDQAEFSLDGEPFRAKEEILRLDNICRSKLNFPARYIGLIQPWAIEKETISHYVTLRFVIHCAAAIENTQLAVEQLKDVSVSLNGVSVPTTATGYYIDKSIGTLALPPLTQGDNILEVTVPIGTRIGIESCYLLGDFYVTLKGRRAELAPIKETSLGFGSIVNQGLPFYGGNITYHIPFQTDKDGRIKIRSNHYRGALQRISIDGNDEGVIAFDPYTLTTKTIKAGEHTCSITVFGNRYNTLGALHVTATELHSGGPFSWRTDGYDWCYEYNNLKETGLLSAPIIELEM